LTGITFKYWVRTAR